MLRRLCLPLLLGEDVVEDQLVSRVLFDPRVLHEVVPLSFDQLAPTEHQALVHNRPDLRITLVAISGRQGLQESLRGLSRVLNRVPRVNVLRSRLPLVNLRDQGAGVPQRTINYDGLRWRLTWESGRDRV